MQEMNSPKVLNKNHLNKIPENSIFVGRPSKWGNPFVIGKDGCREEVIMKYRVYLRQHEELTKEAKTELAGKNLICFCAPKPCHADVLLEISNS